MSKNKSFKSEGGGFIFEYNHINNIWLITSKNNNINFEMTNKQLKKFKVNISRNLNIIKNE